MGLLRRGVALRRQTESLLAEGYDDPLLVAWFVQGSRWLMEGIPDSAKGLDDDGAQMKRVVAALKDKQRDRAMLRVGAWTLAGCCERAGDEDVNARFRDTFGVETMAEAHIADFEAAGHEGDDMRFSRISLEATIMAAGGEVPADGYKNLPMIIAWAGSSNASLIGSKTFVSRIVEDMGPERAAELLLHVLD